MLTVLRGGDAFFVPERFDKVRGVAIARFVRDFGHRARASDEQRSGVVEAHNLIGSCRGHLQGGLKMALNLASVDIQIRGDLFD